MRILTVITGEYGHRHVENLEAHAPAGWQILSWATPRVLPPILDYPEDYLPDALPAADLILALAELAPAAELIPDIAQMTGARAVIAPIDSQAWLPYGLARQLRDWLARIDVACVAPMPFCSLTETHAGALRYRETYGGEPEDGYALIRAFARHFGQPSFTVEVDGPNGTITAAGVTRDACCGCARFIAGKLPGTPVADALERAGLHHHHYPCQASMGIDPLCGDTLMHVSGNLAKDALREALGDNLRTGYIRPHGHADD
jgi:hypothetical protein